MGKIDLTSVLIASQVLSLFLIMFLSYIIYDVVKHIKKKQTN